VITVGALLWAAITALTALLPTNIEHAVLLLIGMRFALGIGESVLYPAANQFVARWVPQQERGVLNGLIFAGVGAGSGLTPPTLAWLIGHYGWRSAFWFSAIVGFIVGIIWWLIARDIPEEHPAVQPAELREIKSALNLRVVASESERPAIRWRAIFHRRDLLALMASYFSYGYIAWIYFSWFFLYMAQVRGFDLRSSARYTMLPFLSMTVGCLAGGILSDKLTERYGLRVGRCMLAAASMVVTALFLIIGSQTGSPHLAGLILACGAGALYVSQSSYWSTSADIAGDNSGIFSSMMNMGGQIGGAVTASLTPWIAQRYGWTTSFAIAASLALISAAGWLCTRNVLSREGPQFSRVAFRVPLNLVF
jgi:ACS family glucarate transporter-like MFS transporter